MKRGDDLGAGDLERDVIHWRVGFRLPTWDRGWSPYPGQPPSLRAPRTWYLFIPAMSLQSHLVTSPSPGTLRPRVGGGEQTAVCSRRPGESGSEEAVATIRNMCLGHWEPVAVGRCGTHGLSSKSQSRPLLVSLSSWVELTRLERGVPLTPA